MLILICVFFCFFYYQPILAKGYGLKDLDSQEPMTNETLVIIASVTKNFVSATMARALQDNPE